MIFCNCLEVKISVYNDVGYKVSALKLCRRIDTEHTEDTQDPGYRFVDGDLTAEMYT